MSLHAPLEERLRLAEYVGVFRDAFGAIEPLHPGWDRTPWEREIRALYRGPEKLIRWSDGARELFDLRSDPAESLDRARADEAAARRLEQTLAVLVEDLRKAASDRAAPEPMTEEHLEMLRSLGYVKCASGEALGSSLLRSRSRFSRPCSSRGRRFRSDSSATTPTPFSSRAEPSEAS